MEKTSAASKITNIILVFLLLAGMFLLAYPGIKNLCNDQAANHRYSDYTGIVQKLDASTKNKMTDSAVEFNRRLAAGEIEWQSTSETEEYKKLLNVDGNGLIGYVIIQNIDVRVPIYHEGDNKPTDAVYHMGKTSLPIGAVHAGNDYETSEFGTASIIDGSKSKTGSECFNSVNKLAVDDVFFINVAGEILEYKINEIQIVNKANFPPYYVNENEDSCALVADTLTGDDTQVIVKGTRIPYDGSIITKESVTNDATRLNPMMITAAIVAVVSLFIIFFRSLHRSSKKAKQKKKEDREGEKPNLALGILKVIGMILAFVVIIAGIIALIPQIPVESRPVRESRKAAVYSVAADVDGIAEWEAYVQENGSIDFDGDGLVNSREIDAGTDPRNPDTDGDGFGDGAEIIVYETNPLVPEKSLVSEKFLEKLQQEEISYGAPYQMNGVTLWANNLKSRVFGTVISGKKTYRFSNFEGWADFDSKVYAYQIKNGKHELLEHTPDRRKWKIDSSQEDVMVELYADSLKETRLLTVFDKEYTISDAGMEVFASAVLKKEKAFLTYHTEYEQDKYAAEESVKTANGNAPEADKTDRIRFRENMNTYNDIGIIYYAIDEDRKVTVSLQSKTKGELFAVVYGYTENGDLLLYADDDPQITNPLVLKIDIKASLYIDENEEYFIRKYFDFSGFGYDSMKGDKIYIWAAQ